MDADEVIQDAETQNSEVYSNIRDAAEWFHKNEGELFKKDEAIEKLQKELDIPKNLATELISELVSDTVDPVTQVNNSKGSFVGVIEYKEFEGAYGYIGYHDVKGKQKEVVCAQCVKQKQTDSEVQVQKAKNQEYKQLLEKIHKHYEKSHDKVPKEVETGATLASGTTVAGNRVIHGGNQGNFEITNFAATGASSGTTPVAQGDGTLVMEEAGGAEGVTEMVGFVTFPNEFDEDTRNEYYNNFRTIAENGEVLNIFTNSVSGPEIVSNQNAMLDVMDESAARDQLKGSDIAMKRISDSDTAMAELTANNNAVEDFVSSPNAMQQLSQYKPSTNALTQDQKSMETLESSPDSVQVLRDNPIGYAHYLAAPQNPTQPHNTEYLTTLRNNLESGGDNWYIYAGKNSSKSPGTYQGTVPNNANSLMVLLTAGGGGSRAYGSPSYEGSPGEDSTFKIGGNTVLTAKGGDEGTTDGGTGGEGDGEDGEKDYTTYSVTGGESWEVTVGSGGSGGNGYHRGESGDDGEVILVFTSTGIDQNFTWGQRTDWISGGSGGSGTA